jgi:hypothetical protein
MQLGLKKQDLPKDQWITDATVCLTGVAVSALLTYARHLATPPLLPHKLFLSSLFQDRPYLSTVLKQVEKEMAEASEYEHQA